MKPIRQTIFGGYTEGQAEPVGNCFQACIASLMELPLDEVPHFVDEDVRLKLGNFHRRLNDWLRPRGLAWIEFRRGTGTFDIFDGASGCCYVASGLAERGHNHSVIYRDAELVHDPHPSAAGLLDVQYLGFLVWIGGDR